MATIVIHAGMPKAGSSSIQRWLSENGKALHTQGITVVKIPVDDAGEINFEAHEDGSLNSGWVINRGTTESPGQQRERIAQFTEGLSAIADKHGNVVLSGESFAHVFWSLHVEMLSSLRRLSDRHTVRIAYYVRPQHEALEAAWRQWGFRSAVPPTRYVTDHATHLHHAATRRGVRARAPGLQFDPSPVRADFLRDEDLIVDFAARFLDIEAEPGRARANLGLPLAAANLLRGAPDGMFWQSNADNKRIEKIKRLLGNDRSDDDQLKISRLILQSYAHERFSAENAELGWNDFVPPLQCEKHLPGIDALGDLWSPQASEAEQNLFFRALSAAIGR